MTSEFENWLNAIKRFPSAGKEHDLLIPVFKANLEYIVANRWQGASSHSSTAVFMVLAREVGVSAKLLMGQCAVGDAVFDHSWVEVRGQIYDIAISNPVLLETRTPPVFAGKSLDGLQKPQVSYGVKNRDNLELEAQLITSAPFLKYMENFSEYRQGLWEVAKEVGKNAGLKLNVEKMRKNTPIFSGKLPNNRRLSRRLAERYPSMHSARSARDAKYRNVTAMQLRTFPFVLSLVDA